MMACASHRGDTAHRDMRCCSSNSLQMIKRLPQLKKIDGIPIDVDEREAAGVK